jgi:hypothetical protein
MGVAATLKPALEIGFNPGSFFLSSTLNGNNSPPFQDPKQVEIKLDACLRF